MYYQAVQPLTLTLNSGSLLYLIINICFMEEWAFAGDAHVAAQLTPLATQSLSHYMPEGCNLGTWYNRR